MWKCDGSRNIITVSLLWLSRWCDVYKESFELITCWQRYLVCMASLAFKKEERKDWRQAVVCLWVLYYTQKHYKSPNLAVNIQHQDEPVNMDSIFLDTHGWLLLMVGRQLPSYMWVHRHSSQMCTHWRLDWETICQQSTRQYSTARNTY